MPDPPQIENPLPKFVGKYRIIRKIAQSNDIVYEAVDPNLGRHVALKELLLTPDQTGAARRERIERFQREAKAAGALKHPNIVTIYEVAQHLEHRFIAMEYLEGQTLRHAIGVGGPFSIPEALRIALQLCDALGYAHTQGVVHRDVKPDNIHLVPPNNTVKLTDFGIARVLSEPSITSAGQVFGTPSYMSPEQLTSRQVDHRSDIFSLAVVIYEMITAKKPFRGDNVIAITYQIMNTEPTMPASIPPGIAVILTKALAKDPDLRYQNMRSLASDIRREMGRGEVSSGAMLVGAEDVGLGMTVTDAPILVTKAGATVTASQVGDSPTAPAAGLFGAIDADERVGQAVMRLCACTVAAALLIIGACWAAVAAAGRYRTNTEHNRTLATYLSAIHSAQGGALTKAIGQYRIALAEAPDADPTGLRDLCLKGLSDCYTSQAEQNQAAGDLDGAQESYNSALDLDHDNAVTRYDLAALYQLKGDQIDALNEYYQAYQDQPTSAVGMAAKQQAEQGYLQLGEQNFSTGNVGGARQNWQRVIDIDPSSSYADQARERMRQLSQ